MKKQKSNVFKIFMVLLCAVVVFCGVGFGSYVLSNISEISSSGEVVDSGDRVTVEFKYQMYTGLTETIGSERTYTDASGNTYTEQTSISTDSATTYNALSSYLSSHSSYTIDDMDSTGTYQFKDTQDSTIYVTIVIETAVGTSGCTTTTYSGKYYMYTQKITKDYNIAQYDSDNVQNTITIPKGSSLTENYVTSILTLDSSDSDYYFMGLVTETDGTYYSYGDAITSDTVFYAIFNKAQESTSTFATGSITSTVNSATSSTNIYNGTGSSSTDVSLDYTYCSTLKSFALGTNGGSATTIASGATINFCLNDSSTYIEASVGTSNSSAYSNYIEPSDNNRQYTITLQSDLEVNGTMVIGGSYGSGSNTNYQSSIYSTYVVVDLNGHNLNVNNGGTLTCYGMVKDSVGTGTLSVTGTGKLTTMLVIHDYKGGTSTTAAAGDGVCPFQQYFMPYLRCTIKFYYSNSSWGSLIGTCRLHVTSYSYTDTTLSFNIIGKTGSETYILFEIDAPADASSAYIEMKYETIDAISEESSSNNTQKNYVSRYCLDMRNKISFHNCTFSLGSLKITVSGQSFYTSAFNFPISSFFDILLYGSELSFSQQIQFQPGLTFYADEDSAIIFGSDSDAGTTAELSILDRSINYWYNSTNTLVSTMNVTAASQGTWLWNATYFWKYLSTASVDIYGKILFTTGNTSSSTYKIAGPCNFNEDNVGTVDSSGNISLYGDQTSGTYTNPFSFVNGNSCYVQTYGYDFEPGTYASSSVRNLVGYCRPLVSYDNKAYAVSSSVDYLGTYDFDTGIFTANDSDATTYCFIQSTTSAMVDDSVSVYSCTENSDHTITANSSTYVYFAGMFLPYSSGTCTTSVLNANTTSLSVSYTNTYWHR